MSKPRLEVAVKICLSAMLSMAAWGTQAQNQAAPMAQQQYQMAVDRANNEPFKVEVQPIQQGVQPGTPTKIKVELRNARNELVNAVQPVVIEVKTWTPSSVEQTQKLTILANTSSSEIPMTPGQAGLWKLEVREANDHLKSGSNYLVVSGARPSTSLSPGMTKKKPIPADAKKKATQPVAKPQGFLDTPRLVLAAYDPQPQDVSSSESAEQAKISLKVSGEGDGRVRADGTSAARVSVFLFASQATDVRVWLAVSQGQLDKDMVIIPRGEFEAEARWTSRTVAEKSKISITQTSPTIAGTRDASATVDFVDPIVGIAFANPIASMNIVEMGTVNVRFVDQNATPVSTHRPLSYRFSVNSAHLKLTPAADQTKAGAFDFSTNITPSALGNVTIEAAVEGLPPITQKVNITGLLLLLFCMLGGVAGALVNHFDRKKNGFVAKEGLTASLLTGLIVALPVTWLYVCIGLPNLNAAFLHSELSAIMVAILAGLGGVAGLKATAKKFGFGLFETSGGDEGAAAAPPVEKAAGAKP